jgi:RNA polymerase sigma-70 factor (ECF subfamily)
MTESPSGGNDRVVFATTHWTRVVASRGDAPEARQALSDLCAAYYEPVVAVLRGERRTEDQARELAHGFFESVLERHGLEGADPARGRFRSYLLGALKHFLANRRRHDARAKRGGEVPHEALDASSGMDIETDFDAPLQVADPSAWPPDADFDRAWALQLIGRALAVLSEEAKESGTLREFEALKPWLTGDGGGLGQTQGDRAAALGMTEGALRVAVHRLRRRFRQVVKTQIAATVSDPADIADELSTLIRALGNGMPPVA